VESPEREIEQTVAFPQRSAWIISLAPCQCRYGTIWRTYMKAISNGDPGTSKPF